MKKYIFILFMASTLSCNQDPVNLLDLPNELIQEIIFTMLNASTSKKDILSTYKSCMLTCKVFSTFGLTILNRIINKKHGFAKTNSFFAFLTPPSKIWIASKLNAIPWLKENIKKYRKTIDHTHRQQTLLEYAAQHDLLELAQLLIENGAQSKERALLKAVQRNSLKVAAVLLEHVNLLEYGKPNQSIFLLAQSNEMRTLINNSTRRNLDSLDISLDVRAILNN